MKKQLTTILMLLFGLAVHAQTQFKIPDPTSAFCISEYRKSGDFTTQLKELGLSNDDVVITVTQPLRKYYSQRAGAKIKAVIEADMCEYGIDIKTKKKVNGMLYKSVGYIVCTRTDIAADQYSDYIDKINNVWKIRSYNVDNLTPDGQDYLINPKDIIAVILQDMKSGKIPLNGLKAQEYDGKVYDVIEVENIQPYVKGVSEIGGVDYPKMMSGNKQKTFFIWTIKQARFNKDYSCIDQITRYDRCINEVDAVIKNGKISIEMFTIDENGDRVYFQSTGLPYDTLFSGLFKDGIDKVYKTKGIVKTGVIAERKMLVEKIADKICSFTAKVSEQEMKAELTPFISSETIDDAVHAIMSRFQNYKPIKGEVKEDGVEIKWLPKGKKGSITSSMIYGRMDNFIMQNGVLKFNTNFSL